MKTSADRHRVAVSLPFSDAPHASPPSGNGDEGRPRRPKYALASLDSPAWLASAERFRARVAAYIRCTTRDTLEVEDLLADVWADLWCEQAVHSNRSVDATILIAHARAACARWKAAHRYEVDIRVNHLGSPPTESTEEEDELRHTAFCRIVDLANGLPRQQFYAIVFRSLRGATFKEVAAAMGCSISAAKTHYRRGIATIKCSLSRDADLNSL